MFCKKIPRSIKLFFSFQRAFIKSLPSFFSGKKMHFYIKGLFLHLDSLTTNLIIFLAILCFYFHSLYLVPTVLPRHVFLNGYLLLNQGKLSVCFFGVIIIIESFEYLPQLDNSEFAFKICRGCTWAFHKDPE